MGPGTFAGGEQAAHESEAANPHRRWVVFKALDYFANSLLSFILIPTFPIPVHCQNITSTQGSNAKAF